MTIRKENLRRLASISALGAGALGASAPANANDIVFSGVIDVKVPHPVPVYTIPGPGGGGGALKFNSGCQVTCLSLGSGVEIDSKPGRYGTQFRLLATGDGFYAHGEPLGGIWGTAAGKSTKSANIVYCVDFGTPSTTFTATDRYMLFRFRGGHLSHDIYGWARLSVMPAPPYVPDVDVIDWAYDTSGVQLPAGYHGDGQHEPDDIGTIEPSTFNATGLPALALGAVGVRKWRGERKAQNSDTGE